MLGPRRTLGIAVNMANEETLLNRGTEEAYWQLEQITKGVISAKGMNRGQANRFYSSDWPTRCRENEAHSSVALPSRDTHYLLTNAPLAVHHYQYGV